MSRWAKTLTTNAANAKLDLDPSVGQRQSTFRFSIVDVVTGYTRQLYPLKSSIPAWSHDTGRTIKRQITGLYLDRDDTAAFNSISSRLTVEMLLDGVSYPFGRYVPYSDQKVVATDGNRSIDGFYDEMYIVDQEIDTGFGLGLNSTGSISFGIVDLLSDVPVTVHVEPSPYSNTASWTTGTRRGQICEQLAIDGDYLSPWFDNSSTMQFIRSFDPVTALPSFDLDDGFTVLRAEPIRSSNLVEAPNRFVVISNGASGVGVAAGPTVARYDVPDSAPHSIVNRGGFVITKTFTRQLRSDSQALAVARNLGIQHTLVEQVQLYTAPDPRYDSYDVVRWQGVNWIETSRSMQLVEGAQLQHVVKRTYS